MFATVRINVIHFFPFYSEVDVRGLKKIGIFQDFFSVLFFFNNPKITQTFTSK